MATEELLVQYDQLGEVAQRFTQQALNAEEMLKQLGRSLEPLSNNGWSGLGATSFFNELDGEALPACQRLIQFLNIAAAMTKEIIEIMQRAEQEAAEPFR